MAVRTCLTSLPYLPALHPQTLGPERSGIYLCFWHQPCAYVCWEHSRRLDCVFGLFDYKAICSLYCSLRLFYLLQLIAWITKAILVLPSFINFIRAFGFRNPGFPGLSKQKRGYQFYALTVWLLPTRGVQEASGVRLLKGRDHFGKLKVLLWRESSCVLI